MGVSFGLVRENADIKVKLILFFMEIKKICLRIMWSVKNIYGPIKVELWKFTAKRKNLGPRRVLNIYEKSFSVCPLGVNFTKPSHIRIFKLCTVDAIEIKIFIEPLLGQLVTVSLNRSKLNEHLFKDSVPAEKLDWKQQRDYDTNIGNRLVFHVLRPAFRFMLLVPFLIG